MVRKLKPPCVAGSKQCFQPSVGGRRLDELSQAPDCGSDSTPQLICTETGPGTGSGTRTPAHKRSKVARTHARTHLLTHARTVLDAEMQM